MTKWKLYLQPIEWENEWKASSNNCDPLCSNNVGLRISITIDKVHFLKKAFVINPIKTEATLLYIQSKEKEKGTDK